MQFRTARRWLFGGATTAFVVAVTIAASVETEPTARPTDVAAAGKLPLGPAILTETRTSRQIAPGVTHIAIERGQPSANDFWTVTIGLATSETEAAELEGKVRAAGYQPRRDRTAGPDPRGPRDRPLGWMVRVGRYSDQAAADRVRNELAARGLAGGSVQHSGEDGHATTGPWSLDVLVVDPARFRGSLRSELTDGIVPGRETTSSVARRTGALAAVNGGYFVTGGAHTTPGNWVAGTDGDPAGISVIGGSLVSEAVNGRPALVVPGDSGQGTSVRRLRTRITVRAADGATREVTGLNRQSGLIVNCGGAGNATPFSHPAHDYTCGNADELVAVTARFGATAPQGPGYQVTLDAGGRVTALRAGRGGSVPARGTVLQGTGTGAQWLRAHARIGARMSVRSTVVDAEKGTPLPLTAKTSVVNGGPLLLRNGTTVLDPVRDGWSPEDVRGADRAAIYNGWYLRRNPRTAAGVTRDGRVVLLTVDGRHPGHSAGLSITETAAVMRSLGAVNALNLDGGGSTAMVVRNAPQGLPSDPTGERAAADALVVLPESAR
ncbi:phosphodiester glycosidase family protein [Streptomyces spinoverrucosus]|uniref:phosphodiester glycosidase family protein n=1 Tax=Streptomyces spinoverrucosus TaxID=284043 RepID=UPI0018C442BC|nr:phosphodiester glycosidase family protein [Streptomyces spinoverrucosus]MBG0851150.1 phosphodiester glycosidase family protein [Streptomyces spinoverrucosus]